MHCVILKKNYIFRSVDFLRNSKIKFLVIITILILSITVEAFGFIRDGAVPNKKGLSFSSISYQFKELKITIRNRNHYNVNFGGTMIFLDRHHREVARAEILTKKIKRNSSRRFNGIFVKGSGNEASSASFLVWEF